MGAAVRVEAQALTDPRFGILGELLVGIDGLDDRLMRHLGIGVMVQVWSYCTDRNQVSLHSAELRHLVGNRNAPDAIVGAGLGEFLDEEHTEIRIKGAEGRIEWLEKKRKASKKGGLARRAKSKPAPKPSPKPLGLPKSGCKDSPTATATALATAKDNKRSEVVTSDQPSLFSATEQSTNETSARTQDSEPTHTPPPPTPAASPPKAKRKPKAAKFEPEHLAYRAAGYLHAEISKARPGAPVTKKFTESTRQAWAKSIDMLNRIDGASYAEITSAIDWTMARLNDEFGYQVLSADSLRKKFPAIVAKMSKPAHITAKPRDVSTGFLKVTGRKKRVGGVIKL